MVQLGLGSPEPKCVNLKLCQVVVRLKLGSKIPELVLRSEWVGPFRIHVELGLASNLIQPTQIAPLVH